MNEVDFHDVLNFWFQELSAADWWKKSDELDGQICTRFSDVHSSAIKGECWQWRKSPQGRLAEILVLDQFSRNIYRDKPEAFSADGMALVLAQQAISLEADQSLSQQEKLFMYLPFMHSESLAIHEVAMTLFDQPGLEGNLDFEHKHKVIIEQFGRYPHRNAILGRESSAEELAFLQGPGSSF